MNSPVVPVDVIETDQQGIWLIGREPGGLSQLFRVEMHRSVPVELPGDTLFLTGDKNKQRLLLIGRKGIDVATMLGERLQIGERLHVFESELDVLHPWLKAQVVKSNGRDYLVFNEAGRLFVVSLTDGALKSMPLQGYSEALLQPFYFGTRSGIEWMNQDKVFRWDLETEAQVFDPPKINNLENIVGLPFGDRPEWFIYGGKRGDLSSFGWRLPSTKIKAKGIVVKFGLDPHQDWQRFLIFHASNRVSSQLKNSLLGRNELTCSVLSRKSGTWTLVDRFTFMFYDTDRALDIYWTVDWNRDGYADLVVVDKKGIRLWPSKASGGLQVKPETLAPPQGAVLPMEHRLLLYNQTSRGGSIEIKEAKP